LNTVNVNVLGFMTASHVAMRHFLACGRGHLLRGGARQSRGCSGFCLGEDESYQKISTEFSRAQSN
jgi:hypothetical protein